MNDIFSLNPDIIRAAYAVAVILKELLERFIGKVASNGGIIPGHSDVCRSVSFEGVSLSDLSPTPSNQQKAFKNGFRYDGT